MFQLYHAYLCTPGPNKYAEMLMKYVRARRPVVMCGPNARLLLMLMTTHLLVVTYDVHISPPNREFVPQSSGAHLCAQALHFNTVHLFSLMNINFITLPDLNQHPGSKPLILGNLQIFSLCLISFTAQINSSFSPY